METIPTTASILANLSTNYDEQRRLLKVLEMWNQLMSQDIQPADVESLGLNVKFLTPRQKRELGQKYHQPLNFKHGNKYFPLYFNLIKMKDGSIKLLDPIIEAPPYSNEQLDAR